MLNDSVVDAGLQTLRQDMFIKLWILYEIGIIPIEN